MTRRATRILAGALLVAVALALLAPAAFAEEAGKPSDAATTISAQDVESILHRNVLSLVALVALKYAAAAAGVTILILEASRARAARRGLVAPLPPALPPAAPFAVGPSLLAFAALLLVQQGLAVVVAESSLATAPYAARLALVTLLPALLATGIVVARRRERFRAGARPPVALSAALVEGGKAFAVGTLATILVGLPWGLFLKALGAPLDAQEPVRLILRGGADQAIPLAVLGIVGAPLWEEAVFRGLLFGGVRSVVPSLAAAAVVAGVFSAVHMNFVALGPLFALAMVLARAYERTNHLATPILAHAAFNASGVLPMLLARGS